ncbi:hypothetical protein F1880_004749 [Penicillium rolfsii]|nr:hypothetical protein F1880_004749 [Penicillium rolfsii]
MPDSNPIRKKPNEVIIRATWMPSSSPPTLPGLTSGSESPSISSLETRSDGGSDGIFGSASAPGRRLGPAFVTRLERDAGVEDSGMTAVIVGMPGDGDGRVRSQVSSSSWSTAAPSVSFVAPSLGDSDLDLNPHAISNLDLSPAESGIYACLFHMLDCHETFDDAAQWRTHVMSHFRTHPPPRTARCPLCPDTEFIDQDQPVSDQSSTFTETSPGESHLSTPFPPQTPPSTTITTASSQDQDQPSAWDRLLNHVAADHYQHGQTLAGSRPDFELMRYLYGRRIISDAQFKAMQLAPTPSSPAYHRSQEGVRASIGSADEPYCAPYSRRREERMRGQSRGVSVV